MTQNRAEMPKIFLTGVSLGLNDYILNSRSY